MRMRFPNSFLLITFLYLCCFTQLLDGRGNNIGRNNPFRNSKQPLRQQKHDEIFSNEFDPSNSNKYAYENDMHDTEIERSRRFNKKRRNSLVSAYTSNTASRLFVAVAAAATAALLTHLLQSLLISKSFNTFTVGIALLTAICVFTKGDYGDFSRSLGVFTILLSKQTNILGYLPKVVGQLLSSLSLAPRKPFPPSESPWAYKAMEDGDVEFSMLYAILTLVVFGGFVGMTLSKPIPLFPSWLGFILGSSAIGYSGTFADSRGDLLRFIAYTILSVLTVLLTVADDVELKSKLSTILGRLLFFLNGIDRQFQIMKNVKIILGKLIVQATAMMYSMKTTEDSNTAKKEDRYATRPPPRRTYEEDEYYQRQEHARRQYDRNDDDDDFPTAPPTYR